MLKVKNWCKNKIVLNKNVCMFLWKLNCLDTVVTRTELIDELVYWLIALLLPRPCLWLWWWGRAGPGVSSRADCPHRWDRSPRGPPPASSRILITAQNPLQSDDIQSRYRHTIHSSTSLQNSFCLHMMKKVNKFTFAIWMAHLLRHPLSWSRHKTTAVRWHTIQICRGAPYLF